MPRVNVVYTSNVTRIGKPDKNRKFPRPIKVTLKDKSIREQILFFKSRLNQSRIYKEVRIHKEERKDVRVRFAKLRQLRQQRIAKGDKSLLVNLQNLAFF